LPGQQAAEEIDGMTSHRILTTRICCRNVRKKMGQRSRREREVAVPERTRLRRQNALDLTCENPGEKEETRLIFRMEAWAAAIAEEEGVMDLSG